MEITFVFVCKVIIYSMAVWRYSLMINSENGPFHIFDWFRHKIGINTTYLVDGNSQVIDRVTDYSNQFAELVGCMSCLMFWVSLVFVPGLFMDNIVYDTIALIGTVWGIATYLEEATN